MRIKKYSILHLPVLSFFSKKLYREIAWNWKGGNLLYLFLLLAICWIPATLSFRGKVIQSMESGQVGILNQLPDIHIVNGRVEVEQKEPYYIRRENGLPLAIIDTTGSMNYIDNENVLALLTETELIVRRGSNQFNTLDLSEVSEFHINKQILAGWIHTAKLSVAPLSYAIFLMLSYIFAVLFLLLIAIAGLLISSIIHASLRYTTILRIAATAMTPSIILISASTALGFSIPVIIYAALTITYLLIGILVCRKKPAETVHPKLKLSTLLTNESEQNDIQINAA